ncbi:MAG: agl cluster protein AglQ [Proteobacteria bacterium]|nr:agl cluster protein AglQ [Pseudomonadota bacterium]
MTTLLQIILECIDSQLEQMNSSDGSMPPGHNGPYHDPETPVRNTGHWLISFSRAYEWTGHEKFRDDARRCADYLLSETARPHGFSFHHRNGPKDHCNGLVGQAWTFEALAETTRLFGDPKYARLAQEVFFQHPFDEESGLWSRLEIDGKVLPFDTAFNHQLWFAACATLVDADRRDEILQRVTRFMDCFDKNLTILPNGLLYHSIEHLLEKEIAKQFTFERRLRKRTKNLLNALKDLRFPETLKSENTTRRVIRETLIYKSLGYHSFNMYAFALLKSRAENHPFWNSERLGQMVACMRTDDFRERLDDNKYGYPYNPPGFEAPYSQLVLENLDTSAAIETTRDWASAQFERCFNPETRLMDRNTEDPITHTARLYELTRMPKEILETVEIDSVMSRI